MYHFVLTVIKFMWIQLLIIKRIYTKTKGLINVFLTGNFIELTKKLFEIYGVKDKVALIPEYLFFNNI